MFFKGRYLSFILVCLTLSLSSQFYNGTSMNFGKNRVQFSDYLWSHYKYEQFNIFFYEEGRNLANYVARSAHLQLKELELQFEHQLSSKIQFVIYNTQNQSRESNIGNYPDEELNPGGFTRIIGDKVFLFFDGNHKHFDIQIRNGVAQILLDNIIYGNGTDELKNEALINFPGWYYNGLIAYLTEKWSVEIEGEVKSYFKSGKFKKFNWLKGKEASLAGRSIWYYIADVYGEEAVSNVLYMSKISRNYSDGILFVLGKSVDNLISDWDAYFRSRFMNDNKMKFVVDSNNIGRRIPRKSKDYQRLIINNDGSKLAYTTHKLSQHKVYVHDFNSNKRKRILKHGHQIDILPDNSFPVIAWHPSGNLLSTFYEKKGKIVWLTYNVKTNEKSKSKLFQFEKVLDASYSGNGKKIAMSAVVNGKTDIYVFDVNSRSQEQLTNDFYDDRHPVFINNDSKMIFSSNRVNDSMRVDGQMNYIYQHNQDLFLYDYKGKGGFKYKPQVLFRLTKTPNVNEKMPIATGFNEFQYLSNQNGIYNQWKGRIDSVVSHIDTIVHYRNFVVSNAVSNYNSNVLWHHSNGIKSAKIFKPGDRNIMNVSVIKKEPIKIKPTDFIRYIESSPTSLLKGIKKTSEVKLLTVDSIKERMSKDSDFLYTDYYIFRDEMDKEFNDSVVEVIKSNSNTAFRPLKINGFPTSDSLARKAKQRNYELTFRTAEVSLDVDNRFLNPQYQRYSGGSSYPMPGMNGFMKYSVADLLEDHLITGGFRISDFFSHEFFLSYSNRKKRLDKQILLYRSTHTDLDDPSTVSKNIIYEGVYRLDYPFSIVGRISTSFSLRYDQIIPLSKDIYLLETPLVHQFWPNIRLDYTFDNTRSLGVNLFSGLRFKLFTEIYQEAPIIENRMLTYGLDVRYYQKIYKSLIWANRLAGGSSIGTQRLMFYLGGVDSWVLPKFNQQLAPSSLASGDYAFQTLATNVRGFIQNGRNGSSFIAMNSEMRWPIIKFLFARPFSSEFLNNFQLIGFGDIGTAWSGTSPFSKDNSLNQQTIIIGGEARTGEVLLKTNKEPIIGGYGVGVRSTVLGYFVRADWAWGVEDGIVQGRRFYLSLTTDF